MPLGIGIGQVVALLREARHLEGSTVRIDLAGSGAHELADALAAGGDRAAISFSQDPLGAAVAIRLIDGEPSVAETDGLRRITRAGTPLLVVRRGGTQHVPYVLPGDILDADVELPLAEIVAAIARLAGPAGAALASRLPTLRTAVARRLIGTASLLNAAIAASRIPTSQFPPLTILQSRMLLQLGLSRGDTLPREPQALALAAGPALVGSVGLGLGAREVVRRLPSRGPLIRAAVAYAGTRALGAARLLL